MKGAIRIKPHHFIDIVTALSAERPVFEPHPYGHAVHAVARAVLADRDSTLEMELGADDICAPCIHNVGGRCDDTIDTSFRPAAPTSKGDYNLLIDRRWCRRLGLAQGDRLTAREFVERLRGQSADLAEIYRENPPERVAKRAADLAAGIRKFLEE
jgi:hypothetical protein